MRTHGSPFAIALTTLLTAGALLSTGCTGPAMRGDSSFSKLLRAPKWATKAPWSKSEEEPPEPYPDPAKMAVTWTPDVLVQSGKTPTRGFGGRLFFFNEKSQAVPVEGTLTIHGFEGNGAQKPTKIRPYKFTPEQFTNHFSQSDFGASYSIWIPWDAAGGEQKRVSLVATFETTEGKLVQGVPTTVMLPGSSPANSSSAPETVLSPQYQAHLDASATEADEPSGLVTTTIRRHNGIPAVQKMSPTRSIRQRVAAIAAAQADAESKGKTPSLEVPRLTKSPDVLPASAQMPVESKRDGVPAPRRITAPKRWDIHSDSTK
jgi:hypothetical protein